MFSNVFKCNFLVNILHVTIAVVDRHALQFRDLTPKLPELFTVTQKVLHPPSLHFQSLQTRAFLIRINHLWQSVWILFLFSLLKCSLETSKELCNILWEASKMCWQFCALGKRVGHMKLWVTDTCLLVSYDKTPFSPKDHISPMLHPPTIQAHQLHAATADTFYNNHHAPYVPSLSLSHSLSTSQEFPQKAVVCDDWTHCLRCRSAE